MSFTPGRYYETLQVQNYQNLRHPSYETIQTYVNYNSLLKETYKPSRLWLTRNKGNNKIIELRTILQRESQNSYRQNQSTTGKLCNSENTIILKKRYKNKLGYLKIKASCSFVFLTDGWMDEIIWPLNLSTLSVPEEDYSRNVSHALNLISVFLLRLFHKCMY